MKTSDGARHSAAETKAAQHHVHAVDCGKPVDNAMKAALEPNRDER